MSWEYKQTHLPEWDVPWANGGNLAPIWRSATGSDKQDGSFLVLIEMSSAQTPTKLTFMTILYLNELISKFPPPFALCMSALYKRSFPLGGAVIGRRSTFALNQIMATEWYIKNSHQTYCEYVKENTGISCEGASQRPTQVTHTNNNEQNDQRQILHQWWYLEDMWGFEGNRTARGLKFVWPWDKGNRK